MEQAVDCSNHPDKNAARLCDDCGKPFCAECLRKNFFGFYYCQDCYPALFKSTSVPEYEIPVDENGLKKIQEQVESQIKESLTEGPLPLVKSGKYIKLGIVIGIALLLLDLSIVYVYKIIYDIINQLHIGSTFISPFVMFFYISSLIGLFSFSYYHTGKYCGKRWKKLSWEWGFWLTLPIIGFAIIMYKQAIDIQAKTGNENAIIASMIVTAVVVAYFVLLLVSSYGGYVGAKINQKKEIRGTDLI